MRPLICLLLLAVSVGCSRHADDHVVHVKSEDPEMNAAIAEARRTLPVFWTAHENPASDESEFFLKVAVTDGPITEHFWMGEIKKEGSETVGTVANNAEEVSNVKLGQKVVIDEKKISDWKFAKAGVTKGGYTIVVLLNRMPKSEAAEIKNQLGWK